MSQSNTNIDTIKDWSTFIMAVIVCVSGVIFWVQTSNDPKFSKIESDIQILRSEIKNIRDDNNEILRVIGALKAN